MNMVNLNPKLLTNIYNYTEPTVKFENLTQVQTEIILLESSDENCIFVSKAVTGKTFGFILGILNNIEKYIGNQIFILEPCPGHTQEVYGMCDGLSKNFDISVNILDGQTDLKQIKNDSSLIQIFVSNPSKFIDFINRLVNTNPNDIFKVKKLLLDEYDDLITRDFDNLGKIINIVKPEQIIGMTTTSRDLCEEKIMDLISNPIVKKYV